MKMPIVPITFAALGLVISLGPSSAAFAHCDTLDGPVVTAARKALDSGELKAVLIWVSKKDEDEVRAAFEKTRAVRKMGNPAKDLADRYFFETVVRIHRAGEGAPYTGLTATERDLGPAIPAADNALREGTVEPLVKLLTDAVTRGARERFAAADSRKGFDKQDVEAGREYVAAYVRFLHYVEHLYEAAEEPARGDAPGAESAAGHTD